MMKYLTKLAAVSAFALSAVAANAQDVDPNTVVATVNGTEITLGHMIITRAQLPQQYAQLPADVLYDGILEQLIQQQLLADELTDVPARALIALENEERSIKAGERIAAISADLVTDEAIQAAYDEMFADVTPAQEYNASHILVETEEEAVAVQDRANAGEDFAELAMELSTGPSGPNGGSLGWFGQGMMVQPFEAAVMEMEAGEVSGPVQTQFGWHIIKLNEVRDQALPSLEELRPEIAGQIEETVVTEYLTSLEEGADITRIEAGTIDPEALSNIDLLEQ
ncbi:peptidylprolyl isomerase [Marivivens niveibacter]|uniref:Parvulin-like PPIase n=2 Tax=Marivivens niveibacter TaxID=1930667 RepID=A0A251X015_9RHOB|nr:peptidylprolyl isomerase [Marivivens niveibacter]OUD09654.1 peptidylprolyl isomerase [Marivivens niveibacter]